MSIHDHIAAQLRRPTGLVGRYVMMSALNRGNAELIDATLALLELEPGDTYCDIGFGGGRSIERAARAVGTGHVYGVDYSPDVVVEGHRRHRAAIRTGQVHLLVADVADLPLRDALFTKISTINTIYFWPDPAVAMQSLVRVLAPGGRLSIGFSEVTKMNGYGKVTAGFTKYSARQVIALMTAAGLEDVAAHAQSGKRSQGDSVACGRRPA